LTLKIIRRIKLRKVIINKLLWIINLLNVNISEGIFYYAGNWNILVPVGKKPTEILVVVASESKIAYIL